MSLKDGEQLVSVDTSLRSEHKNFAILTLVESRTCIKSKETSSLVSEVVSVVRSEYKDSSLVGLGKSRASKESSYMESDLPQSEVDQWTLSSVGQNVIASFELVRLDKGRQSISKVTVNQLKPSVHPT